MDDATYTDAELSALDSISREIDIDAPAERVWDLIARPGWYINDGTVSAQADLRYEGDVAVVTDADGEYRFRTVALDKPRYAAFRLLGTPSRDVTEGTLVEFWVHERAQGGVTLRVLESGFSGLSEDPAVWLKEREGNDRGWTQELAAAKVFVESGPGSRTASGS
jgi:uncharacterized protein YndB with AHSA1/START domain